METYVVHEVHVAPPCTVLGPQGCPCVQYKSRHRMVHAGLEEKMRGNGYLLGLCRSPVKGQYTSCTTHLDCLAYMGADDAKLRSFR
jgi:hypothetical protein